MKNPSTESGRFEDLLQLLAKPARRALLNAGITTFAQLANWSDGQLLQLHGFGPNALNKVRSFQAGQEFTSEIKP